MVYLAKKILEAIPGATLQDYSKGSPGVVIGNGNRLVRLRPTWDLDGIVVEFHCKIEKLIAFVPATAIIISQDLANGQRPTQLVGKNTHEARLLELSKSWVEGNWTLDQLNDELHKDGWIMWHDYASGEKAGCASSKNAKKFGI
jgi:hypothetical protein